MGTFLSCEMTVFSPSRPLEAELILDINVNLRRHRYLSFWHGSRFLPGDMLSCPSLKERPGVVMGRRET